jgi:mono/diheme cytochrome c family protein
MRWLLRGWLLVLLGGLLALGWLLFGDSGRDTDAQTAVGGPTTELTDPALIAKGAYLARVGDCASCHTVRGGALYAGGRAIPTPFGSVPAPNLTPDRATGLGQWEFADFWRAMHRGEGRHGQRLYPAFPYTSYTRVTRDDAWAIFAYLRSVPAVEHGSQALGLDFPYRIRATLAAWRALYFRQGVFAPDPQQSAQWNRGAYLVQGLGHCNECHAERGALGGTAVGVHLTGGQIPQQNWYAPDLSTQQNGGLQGWSEQDIVDLLQTGRSAKGAAFGPMADVVAQSTQHMTTADLRAIAVYLASLPPRTAQPVPRTAFNVAKIASAGEQIYLKRCADCHGRDGNGVAGVYPPLNGNSAMSEPTGINATRMGLLGGFPPATAGNPRPYSMPPFAQQLNDSDVALVVSYIRQAWGNKASIVRPEQVSTSRHTPID